MNLIKSLIKWLTGKPQKQTEHDLKQSKIDKLFKTKRL